MIHALFMKSGLEITRDNFRIRAEQMRALIAGYPTNILASVALALLVVWFMWGKIAQGVLLSWLALLYAFHAFEFLHWLTYPREVADIPECKRWQKQFLLSDSLGGAIWGSAGLLLFVPGEPLYQAILLAVMMGLAAGAIASNLAFLLSQQIYVSLVTLPILFNFLNQGVREYNLLAAMVGLFLLFVMKIGRDQSKMFEQSICRGLENIELANTSQQAEASLQESERRLSEILESVDSHIYLKDTQGRFVFANRPVRELFGASLDEIVGRTDEAFFDAETFEKIRRNDRLVLEEGLTSRKEETVFNLRDGRTSTFFSVKIPLRNEAGNIYALCGISTDITDRKQAEERLLDSYHQLEEKELSKTRFLAAAGHDLRQPIAAANLYVEALKLTSPNQHQNELLERLDQSMSIFSGMLERLLNISKFDAGLVKPEIVSFDLAELFARLEQTFAQPARDKNLRLRLFSTKRHSLTVRTDVDLVQSVLMNLVSNAIKYTERGGILVGIRLRRDKVLLQVWDTGIGIAQAEQARIFDEFYQVANPQRSREGGLGLGLSICQRAITLLDSKVSCRSTVGRGSVFEFSLPLNTERRTTGPVQTTGHLARSDDDTLLNGKQVVVVEDDPLVASGMISLLHALGAGVNHFDNAEDALRHTDIALADFYIVDFSLGGKITGVRFLERLQQQQSKPIRAVVVTGETSSRFICSIADIPWPVLHKPINTAMLLSGLRQQSAPTQSNQA